MKLFFFAISLFYIQTSFAMSNLLVNRDETYAVILIQSGEETQRFYDVLNVPEVEIMGADIIGKKIDYVTNGEIPVQIECDKIVALDFITCGISLEQNGATTISAENGGSVTFELTEAWEANDYASNFNMNIGSGVGEIFTSDDKHFSIYARLNDLNEVTSFYLNYK